MPASRAGFSAEVGFSAELHPALQPFRPASPHPTCSGGDTSQGRVLSERNISPLRNLTPHLGGPLTAARNVIEPLSCPGSRCCSHRPAQSSLPISPPSRFHGTFHENGEGRAWKTHFRDGKTSRVHWEGAGFLVVFNSESFFPSRFSSACVFVVVQSG